MRGRTFRRRKLKQNFPKLDINDQNIYGLSKWMGKRNFKPIKKLKPRIFNDTGRGLMTTEAIKEGDVIISIPQNLLITPKLVLDSELGYFFKRYHPQASGHEILSVFLMCEFSKKAASDWYPYISSLPEKYTIPAYFCEHSSTDVPKSIYNLVKSQRDAVKSSFLQLKPLLDELQKAFPVFKDVLYFELFKWAWSSVNTRCIYMECLENCPGTHCTYHLALAPFLDLLNHSVDAKVTAGFNRANNHYEIISLSEFKKYSQVFISYGCHDNLKLFLDYGFVIPGNENDAVVFSLDDILLAHKFCNLPDSGLNAKLKYIKENNLLRNVTCSKDGFSWNLSIILNILSSAAYDIKLWNSFLHVGHDRMMHNPEYHKLKQSLINMKINEYRFHKPKYKCSECLLHMSMISELCSILNYILIKELS